MGMTDKLKNAVQEARGKVKEMTGDATANRDLQAQGDAERRTAQLKQAGEKVKDAFRKR
jgi:uncharacterized protein YjbJ (UPF0337 family)